MEFNEVFDNGRYKVQVQGGQFGPRITLTDLYTGVTFADGEYRYLALVDDLNEVHHLHGLTGAELRRNDSQERTVFEINAVLGDGAVPLRIRHTLTMFPDHEHFEETVALTNENKSPLLLRDYRFAFRKSLPYDAKSETWSDAIGNFRLIAIPFRVQPDGTRYDYHMDEIYHSQYLASNTDVDFNPRPVVIDQGRGRSESWALTDGSSGLIITKYNPEMIEHSMLETERTGEAVFLTFGGASPSLYDEPSGMFRLEPGKRSAFGSTRFTFYEGLWRRGDYIFRDFMTTHGHGHPEGFDPPVTWNTSLDGDLESLRAEAARAAELGCKLIHIDSGWEDCEGSAIWDEQRLGPLSDFIRQMNEDFGLHVGFGTTLRARCNSYPGLYRRNSDGSTGYSGFYEPCTSHEQFLNERKERLLGLAEAGAKMISFDGHDWRGPCFSDRHGHKIPTAPDDHAQGIVGLAQAIHERYPDVLTVMGSLVWPSGPRYAPVYYLHDLPGSYDVSGAFQFARKPLDDLLAGRAFSTFYHALTYELPQYAVIPMDKDNDNCLAFWWYASTARHIGVGGKGASKSRFQAYRKALDQYLQLKDLYARGDFYGYEEHVHVHVLEDEGRGVINGFNLTDEHISYKLELSLQEIGLFGRLKAEGADYRMVGSKLIVHLEIPPKSPLIVPFSQY